MSEDCQQCGTMMWDLDEDGHCPDCSYYKDVQEESIELNKYEMYEPYYKGRYLGRSISSCIENAYPELLQDEIIAGWVAEIHNLEYLLDCRMRDIADLNPGNIKAVRLPGTIHQVIIKAEVDDESE